MPECGNAQKAQTGLEPQAPGLVVRANHSGKEFPVAMWPRQWKNMARLVINWRYIDRTINCHSCIRFLITNVKTILHF